MKNYKRWLLHLYPQAWRARYEDEFLALLEACPFSFQLIWDVWVGAIDAQLHLETLIGRISPQMNRLRTMAVVVFCAYIGLVVAGLAFGQMVEYDDFQQLLRSNGGVAVSYWMLYAAAFAALLAMLVGGLPIAFAAVRFAVLIRRWRLLALFAVPPLSLAVWIGYILIVEALNPGDSKLLSVPPVTLLVVRGLFVGIFILAAFVSSAAVSLAVVHSEISEKLFSFARIPAIITALAMVVMSIAVLSYGLAARVANPQLFAQNNGLLASNTTLSWLTILAIMALATTIAVTALIRGNRLISGTTSTLTLAAQPAD
jgi:MFS family permease